MQVAPEPKIEEFYIGEETKTVSVQTEAEQETNEQRLENLSHRLSMLEAKVPSVYSEVEQPHNDHEDDDDEENDDEEEDYIQDILHATRGLTRELLMEIWYLENLPEEELKQLLGDEEP